jgi:hypothetical protein
MEEVIGKRATVARADNPVYQGFRFLHWGFVAVPAVAGIDKFTHLLTNWDHYLAPTLAKQLPFSGHTFMRLVGVIEMLAALIVAVRPRVGAYVVAAWLAAVIVDLVMLGGSLDIALRDFGLIMGALALGRLSTLFDPARRTA